MKKYINKIIQGDCLEIMKEIPDNSIDMILCDLPYGTTVCSWDTIIPFEPLWELYKRIIKDNGAIVLTASQPFTSKLVMSNLNMFKYELIWEKPRPSNFYFAKNGIMKYHESILVFYKEKPTFNPVLIMGKPNHASTITKRKKDNETGANTNVITINISSIKYPKSILKFNNEIGLHPTQKPVALFEYLIKTYTNKGDLVLDNCIGSGTTAVACKHLKRKYIGIEISPKYCKIAKERLRQEILL